MQQVWQRKCTKNLEKTAKTKYFLLLHFILIQCNTMYTNNNTNNSRKENYNHSNFLFYNNNYNNK